MALVDPNFGDVIVVCPDASLRDRLVFSNSHFIDEQSEVHFNAWSFFYNMNYNPTNYQALIRLTGVPLHDWTPAELRTMVSAFGYPLRTLPYFMNGNYQDLRMLIACRHPADIPRYIHLTDEPYGATIDVILEGWRAVHDDPPEDGWNGQEVLG